MGSLINDLMPEPDDRLPGYLGRVLSQAGAPIGTCFQLTPGLLVTAWHVLDDIDAAEVGASIKVDSLAEPHRSFEAKVERTDAARDLAVLTSADALDASIPGLIRSDDVPLLTDVIVTGVPEVNDPGHNYDHLDAPGRWQGKTTRDGVRLGRIEATAIVPGMSGAPVRQLGNDFVLGIVSARYNSSDGWLQNSVWVIRTEYIHELLSPLAHLVEVGQQHGPTAAEPISIGPYDLAIKLRSPGDEIWINHLASRLKREFDVRVLLDEGPPRHSKPWRLELGSSMQVADCYAIIVGQKTSPDWLMEEITRALQYQNNNPSFRIVPVVAPGVIHYIPEIDELRTWADFRRQEDQEFAFHVISQAVKGQPLGLRGGNELSSGDGVRRKLIELGELGRYLEREVVVETQKALMQKWLEDL